MSDITAIPLNPPQRILMGPGPSNIHPRVQAAMLGATVGHLDPYFLTIMDDTQKLLRHVFQTKNELTLPVSGTGSSGMEASLCNFIEPGDTVVIGVNGFFGDRLVEMAARYGARVVTVAAEWGSIIEPEAIEKALKAESKVKLVAIVHAETSTGILQPLEEISKLAHQHGALFLADAVTSLGGHEVAVDDWGIDICYSGTQKCLGAPSGMAPVTANAKAVEVMKSRKAKSPNWYLDLELLYNYWSNTRSYHHTAPISMVYATHEALALIAEEGLQARFARHARHGQALQAGIEAMGLTLHADKNHRLNTLTAVRIPDGIEDAKIRGPLLNDWNLEIGGGLGKLKGKIWRLGLMGHSSTPENVLLCLTHLEKQLAKEGFKSQPGAGVAAAVKKLQ